MEFGLAFSYIFKDKDWFKKISIVGLVGWIPFIGTLVLYGWMMKITRMVMDQNLDSLPEMEFGGDLSRGFMGFVISQIYLLPAWLGYSVFVIIGMAGSYLGLENITEPLSSTLKTFSISFLIGYLLIFGLVLPAAFTRYLERNSLIDAFNFVEVFKIVAKNPGIYLLVFLGTIIVWLINLFGGSVLFIGFIWTMSYGMAVMGYLYGQAYNQVNKPKLTVNISRAA